MVMGPSRTDPSRRVGTFADGLVQRLTAERAAAMEQFRWIAGEWNYENVVPSTRLSPAYTDVGSASFALCDSGAWVCALAPGGVEHRNITFDPFSKQWIYVLTRGSYGVLRSAQGWSRDQIVFNGFMTMLGVNCEWRMSWTRISDDEFKFVNEEQGPDGSWNYIDEWRFRRSGSAGFSLRNTG